MLNSVFLIFDIGGGEIILIVLVALLLFGGEKLPELARGLGKGIRDFKDASESVKREISNQMDSFEAKKEEEKAAEATEALPEHKDETAVPADHLIEGHVANTIPAGESHVATDHADFVEQKRSDDHIAYTPVSSVSDKEKHS